MSACKHKVSGTISLPSRGAFHLSLTVLLLYRSSGSILAWRVVPPASHGIPRAPRYSGSGYVHFIFDYVALTLFDWPSQTIRLTKLTDIAVHNPAHIATYGLASSDFARHYFRNRFYFLFLRVIRCFSSPGSPDITIYSLCRNAILLALSSLIRISVSPFVYVQLLTAFRSLSRPSSAPYTKASSLRSL